MGICIRGRTVLQDAVDLLIRERPDKIGWNAEVVALFNERCIRFLEAILAGDQDAVQCEESM